MAIIINRPPASRTTSTATTATRTTAPRFSRASNDPHNSQPSVEYVSVVKFVVFSSPDGFKIVRMEDGKTVKVNDLHNTLTPGLTYRFSGTWKESRNPQYPGKDFAADFFTLDKPTSERGIVGYLSKTCTNVGDAVARAIYAKFGEKSIEVVRNSPELLATANILDLPKAKEAAECLEKFDGMEKTRVELLGIMHGHGFGGAAIDQCIKEWGVAAPELIRRDPFKLMVAGIKRAGFARCDKLYQTLGLNPSRLKRQMLAIWYKLKTNRTGHTWVNIRELGSVNERAMTLGLRSKWIATKSDSIDQVWYASGERAKDERSIAKCIGQLMGWKRSHGEVTKVLWPSASDIEGISDHQRATLSQVLTAPIAMLNGKPGTGKTFSVAKLTKLIIQQFSDNDVGVCAPTGKAARRVQENLAANGVAIQARTIHSMFGLMVNMEDDDEDSDGGENGGGTGETAQPSTNHAPSVSPLSLPRFIIVDEVSMLDASVAARLLNKLPNGTHLLLVGDVNQLPPVGHGSPLRDLLRSKVVPAGELTEIRRNSGTIVTACHAIAAGRPLDCDSVYDPEAGKNLRYIESSGDADTVEGVVRVCSILPGYGFDPVNDCQVIAALNVKGNCSKAKINGVLQGVLNPAGKKVKDRRFRVNDKVIYTKNMTLSETVCEGDDTTDPTNYYNTTGKPRVANGDIGRVVAVDEKCVIVRFDAPDRVVRLTRDVEIFLDLAYAVSCHKYQGSESPVVIVVLDPAAVMLCSREYMYTAISRAKALCVLVGPAGLADRFCKRVSINTRKTFLVQELKERMATNG